MILGFSFKLNQHRRQHVPKQKHSAPTPRDRHLHGIAEHGRAARQKASGYTKRSRAEAAIRGFKPVIGGGLG